MPCFSEDNVTFTKGQSYKQRKCVGIETAKEEREDKRGFLKKNILSEISHLS